MFEIQLNLMQPRREFAFTFLHELGHLVRHGATRSIADGGIDLANVDRVPDADFRERMRALLLTREREADAFADQVLQQVGGDFYTWIFAG